MTEESFLKEALEYLVGMGKIKTQTLHDQEFALIPGQGVLPVKPYHVELTTIKVQTLDGFLSMIKEHDFFKESVKKQELFAVIDSPNRVLLQSRASDKTGRPDYWIEAEAPISKFTYGTYMSQEDFVVNLKRNFDIDDELKEILALISNISRTTEVQNVDDGLSQKVAVADGITLANKALPDEVLLRPFSTFPELEQPTMPCFLRLQKSERHGISMALFDVDNGRWVLESKALIANYLKENGPKGLLVVG